MRIAALVARNKAKHPEQFCPSPRCLWRTAKLDHATQTYSGGGPCPRHAKDYPSKTEISAAGGTLKII